MTATLTINLRALLGVIFTILQYTYFYPNGFDITFRCNVPPTGRASNLPKNTTHTFNNTSVRCKNTTASEKRLLGLLVTVINSIVALAILAEVIYLSCRRLPFLNFRSQVTWANDSDFVNDHLLRKRYIPLAGMDSLDFYRQEVLNCPRAHDICYGMKSSLNDLYVHVLIHTEQARHISSRNMNFKERHEIFDIYTKVPENSILLEKIKDLFYPNEDTNGEPPRSVLVIGRPGIGKTVLTENIRHDWANKAEVYYCDKIAFNFKLRWFNDNAKEMNLETFLYYGTEGLSREEFKSIYNKVINEPTKALLIFDGLDEFVGNFMDYLDKSIVILGDQSSRMSAMNIFIKLVLNRMLKGATVLVTSRPTAVDFYFKLNFDQQVEILGFTTVKIEEYVLQFCRNNNRSDLKPKIWKHIQSSPDLLNLCYIPVNCFIVCVTLSDRLSVQGNSTAVLPTTLTKLYETAINHFQKYHHRKGDSTTIQAPELFKKLQELAFHGMEREQLVFDEQVEMSGLVYSLSNPIFPLKTQFCFIHLTIQEFLAARHVTETLLQ